MTTAETILCSQSLLTYKEEREVFGKAVADQYVVAEVRIQNRNTQYPFLLADVRLGAVSSELTTSRDRTFVRSFAEKGEAYSVRAIALRALAAAGAILGGIGPAVGDKTLSNAIQIIVGPTTSAANGLFPDRSAHEIETITDYGFSVVQTLVIPTRSPARVYCFIPQRQILPEAYNKISDDNSKWANAAKFQKLQRQFFVEIAGMHVTQVKVGPGLDSLNPGSVQLGNTKSPIQISVTGTGFEQIRYLQVGDDVRNRYLLDPVAGSNSSATISINNLDALGANSKLPSTLSIYLITTGGEKINTNKQITITPAAAPAAPSTPNEPAAPSDPNKPATPQQPTTQTQPTDPKAAPPESNPNKPQTKSPTKPQTKPKPKPPTTN